MADDHELAGRIRQLIGSDPELTEMKMFGGLAFLTRGKMAVGDRRRFTPPTTCRYLRRRLRE